MSTDHNPYQAPTAMDLHVRRTADRGPAKAQLRPPAVALIVLSVVATVLDLVILFRAASVAPGMWRGGGPDGARGQIVNTLVANAGLLIIHAIVCYGSMEMLSGGSYPNALTAAMVSLVPFCSPVVLLGVPFAIWALVVLRRTEVKESFRGRVGSTSATPPPDEPISG